jgi:Putative porin
MDFCKSESPAATARPLGPVLQRRMLNPRPKATFGSGGFLRFEGCCALRILVGALMVACSGSPSRAQTSAPGAISPSPGLKATTCASAGSAPIAVGEFRFCGELGVRGEFIGNENFAAQDSTRADNGRFRERVRVRTGVEYRVAEPISIGLRLSSGDPSFPSSAWSSFSDDFRRKPIQIDRAFARWQITPRVQLVVGLQPNPIFAPTELLWDPDVHPAGVSQTISLGSGVAISAGQFMLREVRSSKQDNEEGSWLIAEGISSEHRWNTKLLKVGGSLYWFTNPDALSRSLQIGDLDAEFKTNRFDPLGRTLGTTPLDYFSDFKVVSLATQFDDSARTLGIRVEAAVNAGARSAPELGEAYRKDQRFAVGGEVRYGRTQNAGDWALRGGFYHIEADAVVAVYNSDDLQQTNVNVAVGEVQRRFAGRTRLVWDTYFQKKIDTALASNGGVVHPENAMKVRTRLSLIVDF